MSSLSSLYRGAFEPQLADEDEELDPDRWCSRTPAGQEAWQIVAQWVWNLRLELGHQLEPSAVRTTEFAPAVSHTNEQPAREQGYGQPLVGRSWTAGRFSGEDFALQPDGTVRCPAGKALFAQERRREPAGSLRIVYEARMGDCRCCRLRAQCQWHGKHTQHPRRMSVLLHPLHVGPAPLLWKDWSRRAHRRACIQLLRHQRVEVTHPQTTAASQSAPASPLLSRAQRAHTRLSWQERLVRNARAPTAPRPLITLFGVPDDFAVFLGLSTG